MAQNLVKVNHNSYTHLEFMNDAIVILDKSGHVLYSNQKTEALLGCDFQQLWEFYNAGDLSKKSYPLPFISENKSFGILNGITYEKQLCSETRGQIWVKWTCYDLDDYSVMLVIQDATTEQKLKKRVEQLEANNTLLRQEAHHRIKNNMQIVMSLLNLQFRHVESECAIKALAKSRKQLAAISTVHNFICASKGLYSEDFTIYLNRLLSYISHGYQTVKSIRLKGEFDGHFESTEHLVSLGLIISELVVNAYEHAFQSKNGGTISVSIRCGNNGRVDLSVSDNGCGIQSPINLKKPERLVTKL